MHRFFSIAALIIFVAMIITGCSSKSNPISSITPDENVMLSSQDIPGHSLVGIWEMVIDPDTLEGEIVPVRDLAGHMNITGFVTPLGLHVNSFNSLTKIMNVDVTINNGTSYSGYDVRIILFTNDQGLKLTNSDGWTDLFDIPGGEIRNPFKAYAKDNTNRIFAGNSSEVENMLIYWPSPTGAIQFAVDASFPSNCVEPYAIQNFQQVDLLTTDRGSSAEVRVDVLDWQSNVDFVNISVPEITGVYFTAFSLLSGITWTTMVVNNANAIAGDYSAMLAATSGGYYLYDFVSLRVSPGGSCPDDDNEICTDASLIGLQQTISGCVDGVDTSDWFELQGTSSGISSGTIDLTILSGEVNMMVYKVNDSEICPGTLFAFAGHVVLDPISDGNYLIRIFSNGELATYRVTVDATPVMTNFPTEIYVAVSGGNWPIYERLGPDITLTPAILTMMMTYANNFWNQYGYNLVWDGTATEIASQYYILNSFNESQQMHYNYGRTSNKLALYFVDVLDSGNTAYCVPGYPKSQHTDDNVYTVYSPNVWYWQSVIAHEQGHELGYFVDQYLYGMAGCACGNNSCLGAWQGYSVYLYSDPTACYYGNLMMGEIGGYSWDDYSITSGQQAYMNWFHNAYPNNFVKY